MMTPMTLPAKRPADRPEAGWDGRARIIYASGRKQFVHVWTAPRSPAARIVVVPLLLLAALLIVAVGLLALLVLLAVAVLVAFVVLLVSVPLAAIRGRGGPPARRP